MNKTTLSPELDDVIRQSYDVPPVRSEFVNRTYDDLMKRADRKSMRSNRTVLRLRFGLGLAAVLLLFGLIFGQMPEGQALAESIRHFFKIATVTEIPVTDPNLLNTPTLAPTFAVTLAPAVNAAPTNTPLPTPEGFTFEDTQACQTDPYGYYCKIAWAEKKTGFDIKEFPADPLEMRFEELYVEESKVVWINYARVGGGAYLHLVQGPDTGFNKFGVGVPEDTVQQVVVGEYPGEYVAGTFGVGMGETSYSWKPGGKYSLRWSDGSRWFEIISFGCVGRNEQFCAAEGLVELALSLVDEPIPSEDPRADNLTSVEEAEAISGFPLQEPQILPEGFSFHHGTYDVQLAEIRLNYGANGYDLGAVSIILRQIPNDQFWLNSGETWDEFPGERVDINGQPGIYDTQISNNTYSYHVIWQSDKLIIQLWIDTSELWYGATFTREQVLEIARSVK
ncbi:MAG: hypothetical protein ACYC11_02420 [Bellilinea sp.]